MREMEGVEWVDKHQEGPRGRHGTLLRAGKSFSEHLAEHDTDIQAQQDSIAKSESTLPCPRITSGEWDPQIPTRKRLFDGYLLLGSRSTKPTEDTDAAVCIRAHCARIKDDRLRRESYISVQTPVSAHERNTDSTPLGLLHNTYKCTGNHAQGESLLFTLVFSLEPRHSFEMSQASSYNYGKFALGPVDPSTGKRTFIPSIASTHKVPAYNHTQASNAHVSGLRSEYSVAAIAQEDEEDSSEDTDDRSEEDDAEPEEGESERTDESDSESSEVISEDIARLGVEDGEGEESDNSDSGSGDATSTDEKNDEAVTSAEDDDDVDNDQPTMPPSILKTKTGPSTRRKSVVMIAPGFSAPETDPGYYKAQAKADKQILEKWFVSKSEAEEQADALARVKDRKKRWSAHEVASTGSGTMSSGTAQPIPPLTGSETDSRTTTTIAKTT